MVGISAGAMCWFEQLYEEGRVSKGLGVLEGSLCPHYGADEESADYDQWAATQPQLTHYRLKNEENLHLWHGERLVAINVQEVPHAE